MMFETPRGFGMSSEVEEDYYWPLPETTITEENPVDLQAQLDKDFPERQNHKPLYKQPEVAHGQTYAVPNNWSFTHEETQAAFYNLPTSKPSIEDYDIQDTDKDEADRYNKGKLEMSYLLDATYAVEGLVAVLMKGAEKYERDNWKKGMPARPLLDSLLRHALAYMSGEVNDKETGLPHVDHLLSNALFLSYHHNGRKPA